MYTNTDSFCFEFTFVFQITHYTYTYNAFKNFILNKNLILLKCYQIWGKDMSSILSLAFPSEPSTQKCLFGM